MSFLVELKRRNVIRVGIAYVVTSWLLMQVADLVFPRIGLEDSAVTLVIALLGIGFVPALIFAWAFELTPEGIKKEKDVDRSQSITQHTGRKLDFTIIGILVIALGYFTWDKFVWTPGQHAAELESAAQITADTKAAQTVQEKSIAVLPFVNMSDDADNEYFSDGISEEILNALAKVKELKVAGRTSSFAFKGQNQDLRRIGETLGVKHILEGSVRKYGDQLRITAQLIHVDDGFHLWSESYDRKLDNVFAIQDEIATAILTEMKATLLDGETSTLAATRTDPKAYERYLLARQRMYERTELSIQAAGDLLDEAIAIDPNYAPAYAQRGIASLLLSVTSYGSIPKDQARAEARRYLDQALALDANQAEALAGMGLYYNGPPNQPYKSIAVLEQALAINPNLINASNWLNIAYWSVNRLSDSMTLLDNIISRDPLYKPAVGNRAFMLTLMGRADEARAYVDSVERFVPGDPFLLSDRAQIELFAGNVAEGLSLMQKAHEVRPSDRVVRVGLNRAYNGTHQYERVFDDEWSDQIVWALFNQGRTEEASVIAKSRATNGAPRAWFALLNATGKSEDLLQYFDQRWSSLDDFRRDVPAGIFGYREMTDLALAYRRSGNQQRFDQAMAILHETTQQTLEQGVQFGDFLIQVAAWHAMAGDEDAALNWLAQAIDAGLIVAIPISSEYPYFRDLEGHPDYQAIQQRMVEHLNNERVQLGLGPVST